MMRLTTLFIVAILCTIVFGADIVTNGKADATIVLPVNATRSARFAAAELQYHIKLMTGTDLPCVTQVPDDAKTVIHIGGTPEVLRAGYGYEAFKEQEYLVMVKGNEIFLTGHENPDDTGEFDYSNVKTFPNLWRPIGCTYAVYDFLEKLGVRWYLPTDIGTVYDKSDNLRIDDCFIRRVPSMETRFSNYHKKFPAELFTDQVSPTTEMLNPRDVKLWHLRRRAGGKHYIINHSLGSFRGRFDKTHPEWYAKTESSVKSWDDQLCFTHPEVIAQIAKDARDFFDGKVKGNVVMGHATPDYVSDAFTIVPMDNGRYCQCDRCRELRATFPKDERGQGCFSSARNSDYFFSLVNAVAKEVKKTHPDKLIATLAYSSNAYPPSFRLEDNVIVMMCLHSRHLWSNDMQKNDDAILDAWNREYPNMKKYVWLYWCFPSLAGARNKMFTFPGFIGDHVPDMIEKYYQHGVKGFFWEISTTATGCKLPLYDELEIYLFTALAWNREQSGKELTDEFFKRYYGLAAEPMRQFYTETEAAYCNPANYPNVKGAGTPTIYHVPSWTYLATSDRMERLGKYIAEAKELAATEPYKSRVELFEKGVWKQMVKGKESGPSVPIQQESIPRVKLKVAGAPDASEWRNSARLKFYGGLNAQPLKRSLTISAMHDGESLYLKYYDEMDTATLETSSPATWLNDEWESSFARQRSIPYRHVSTDANGKLSAVNCTDTGTRNYPFPAKVSLVKTTKHWEIIMTVKLADIVDGGIQPGEILFCNFIRACNAKPIASWNPTYSGFHAPSQLGEFYLEK